MAVDAPCAVPTFSEVLILAVGDTPTSPIRDAAEDLGRVSALATEVPERNAQDAADLIDGTGGESLLPGLEEQMTRQGQAMPPGVTFEEMRQRATIGSAETSRIRCDGNASVETMTRWTWSVAAQPRVGRKTQDVVGAIAKHTLR